MKRVLWILLLTFNVCQTFGQSAVLRVKKSQLAQLEALAEKHPETRYLILKNVRLRHIPEVTRLFPNLDSLDLYNNKIENIPDSVWESLGSLSYLRLGKNPMRYISSGIRHMQNLKTLDFWNAEIESFDEAIYSLPNLQHIDVRATRLSRSELDKLRNGLADEVSIKATWQCNCR